MSLLPSWMAFLRPAIALRHGPARVPCCRHWRRASSAVARLSTQQRLGPYGKDGERILQVVAQKVQERDELLELLNDEAPHLPEQIQRARTVKELDPLHSAWEEWRETEQSLAETQTLLQDPDPDIRALALEDQRSLSSRLSQLIDRTFPALLVPPSRTAEHSALLELKSGVGGDESSIFLAEMMRMYTRFITDQGWSCEAVNVSEQESGRTAVREAMLEVKGAGSYDALRWENGVHRVQRVPATETSGRVHTSTVQVLVWPSAPSSGYQVSPEEDVVDEKDVKVEVMRARGAGGQHVNRTESAVRLTHEPTGITVSMQDSRSQAQNRTKAWQILRARLLDRKLAEEAEKKRSARRSMVKTADRSEKVRTYNFPQDRVTDHRIGLTLSNIASVMEGERLQDIIDALEQNHRRESMEDLLESA